MSPDAVDRTGSSARTGRGLPALATSKPVYQRAGIKLKVGKHGRLAVSAKLTSGGLMAVGGLVAAIVRSSAVLVRTAVREAKRPG